MKKIIFATALMLPMWLQANEMVRGSIITNDNKIVAETTKDNTRVYPYHATLEPLLGYTNKSLQGKQGLEKSTQFSLAKGLVVRLTVNLALQKKIETLLDEKKKVHEANEVIVGVMESKTGKILVMASSNRYDPSRITQRDISALNLKFSEYPYEPGSVMKPISIAIALDHGLVTPETLLDTHNGKLELEGNHTITDDDKFESLTTTNIIVHSSSVGSSLISWMLTGKEFRDGLLNFGFGKPSGVDLSRDLSGIIKDEQKLSQKLHRANTSYGYGMTATFLQLMKAYASFNNRGLTVEPKLTQGSNTADSRAISEKTAEAMHNILLEVVKRGTGVKAQYPGLEIGGKTGTAHMVKEGKYVREYHSSFYGFANDDESHRYTIGVLVIRAKAKYKYFASQSAVPIFKDVVNELVKSETLLPSVHDKQMLHQSMKTQRKP